MYTVLGFQVTLMVPTVTYTALLYLLLKPFPLYLWHSYCGALGYVAIKTSAFAHACFI